MMLGALAYIPIILLSIPTAVFAAECVAAMFSKRQSHPDPAPQPRLAVLIPAHNEAAVIEQTLQYLLPQLNPQDRAIVIADNCSDATAQLAQQCGAEVLKRANLQHRGKGFALDHGLRHLEKNPPQTVVIVDADCHVHPGALQRIAAQSQAHNRPVQALYLMAQPAQPKPKDAVSALAFLVKNLVRPTGLQQLGLPCLLTGTGMAFPWALIKNAPLASGNIVEDMQLGLDLAMAGYPPMFCGEARVTGTLPQQASAATSQRTRWEHGHLQTLLTQVPRLLRHGQWGLAAELCVPPLALLVLLWLVAFAGAALVGLLPCLSAAVGLCTVVACVVAAWLRFGQDHVAFSSLLQAPLYVLWKLPIYAGFVLKRQKAWVRTERDP